MPEESCGTIPKPAQTRGLLHAQIKRNLIGLVPTILVFEALFYFLHVGPHKKRYADFYKHYDINKTFEEIRCKGCFQSCSKDDE